MLLEGVNCKAHARSIGQATTLWKTFAIYIYIYIYIYIMRNKIYYGIFRFNFGCNNNAY